MLSSYSSSTVPPYTYSPSAEEATLEYTPRYPLRHTPHYGNFVQKWKKATLILKGQDEKEEIPCYGRNSIINGELGLVENDICTVVIKLQGQLTLSVSDVGSTSCTLINDMYTLWKRSDDPLSRCPSVLPFSIRTPLTYQDGGETKKLPPSYGTVFYGIPSLWVSCVYSFSVIITRNRPRYGLWKPSHTYNLRINYRPRSRPSRPVVRDDSIFSMLKFAPEEWLQIMDTLRFQPSSSLEPLNCHFLIPSVQTFGLQDTIPIHIQLIGSLESLAQVFPPSTSDNEEPSQQLNIRVCLVRKTLVSISGEKHWRNRSIGEAKIWSTPPLASTRYDSTVVSADWEGELRCNPDVRSAGFNVGNVAVQDFLLFTLGPSNPNSSSIQLLQYAHAIKLVTDSWSEDSTTHPQDV